MNGKGTLILGTANPGKTRELALLLAGTGLQLATLADVVDPLEVQETGRSYAENARRKASLQARHLGQWVLADDAGLEVDALDGAPGVRSARFAGPDGDAAANRRRLLREMAGVPLGRRTARFVCRLALADPNGAIRAESGGRCEGRIRFEPSGQGGFGYDPLFEIVEYHRTFAELGETAKNVLSHRGRAMERMAPQISALVVAGAWQQAVGPDRQPGGGQGSPPETNRPAS